MERKNLRKQTITAGAFLFSILFTLFLKIRQAQPVLDASGLIFSVTNFLTILFVVSVFDRIRFAHASKPVHLLKKSLVPSFLFFFALTLFASLLLYSLGIYVLYLVRDWNTEHYFVHLFQRDIPGAYIPLAGGLFFASLIFFYTLWRQAIDRELRLQKENLHYRYKTLKTQLNPHFLFNSLNTLSEIIYQDTRKADRYIQKLAGIYRYMLEKEANDLIPCHEEINFVNQYFDLQKERAGDKICLDIYFPEAEKYQIIPVSLQVLVENALKHNSATAENPLKIQIYREDTQVVVTNLIQRKNIWNPSPGTGLFNLSERIRLSMGKKIVICEENNRFTVKLPLVEVE